MQEHFSFFHFSDLQTTRELNVASFETVLFNIAAWHFGF